MPNLVVFLVGLVATGLVGSVTVTTWLEFRKMDTAEPLPPALPRPAPPV